MTIDIKIQNNSTLLIHTAEVLSGGNVNHNVNFSQTINREYSMLDIKLADIILCCMKFKTQRSFLILYRYSDDNIYHGNAFYTCYTCLNSNSF